MTDTKNGSNAVSLREIAVDACMEILEKEAYSHYVLRQVLEKYGWFSDSERHFLTRLIRGAIQSCIRLDWIIDQYSKTPVKKQKPFIRNLLRITAFQILYLDSVPDHAACSEAVKLAKKRGFAGLSGFVNGVSRSSARGKEKLELPADWEIRYSVPQWIIHSMNEATSPSRTERSLQFLNDAADSRITIHLHSSKASVEEIQEQLTEEGIAWKRNPWFEDVCHIQAPRGLGEISCFEDGLIQPQDFSSILACKSAGITPGMKVLDLCAAPGGKSLFAADALKGSGLVVSRDLTEDKTELIRENASRIGTSVLRVEEGDATVFVPEFENQFDVVIADVPCSGIGVLARKPDIRFRRTPEDVTSLKEIQRQILTQAVSYVKPGGILMFSTCTVAKEENTENLSWLLEKFPLSACDLREIYPQNLLEEECMNTAENGYVQLLPGELGGDGFFFARLRKMNRP